MRPEERERIHELLNTLGSDQNLSAEILEKIEDVRDYVNSVDESAGEEERWEEKYKAEKQKNEDLTSRFDALNEAYRKRWDETTTGTKVNGAYVDKTVDRVTDYTYDKLLIGRDNNAN